MSRLRLSIAVLALFALAACPKQPVDTTPHAFDSTIPDARPAIPASDAFTPPVPAVVKATPFAAARLLERPALDLVSVRVVTPYGSASDPQGKAGLADLTAEMMEQGAGEMDAFELALAAERIGADISVWSTRDIGVASIDTVSGSLEGALELLAEVLLRPRFDESEWERSHSLWLEDLKARAFEPAQVAGVVSNAVLFGREHPYGHPGSGWLESVESLTLDDVRAFHESAWRLDQATIVVVGKVTASELTELVGKTFGEAVYLDTEAPAPPAPDAPEANWPKLVIVHQPDKPQTVLRVIKPGPAASEPRAAAEMVDFVLGGSFTSRLMANLREDKGYTYGASSGLPYNRGVGRFAAGANVQTEVTGKALKELLSELSLMAAKGVTDEEIGKARASKRNEDVEAYEQVAGTAGSLATIAGLGLPPEFAAEDARARAAVDTAGLQEAAAFFDPAGMVVVAVGDKDAIMAQLAEQGIDLGEPLLLDEEAKPVE